MNKTVVFTSVVVIAVTLMTIGIILFIVFNKTISKHLSNNNTRTTSTNTKPTEEEKSTSEHTLSDAWSKLTTQRQLETTTQIEFDIKQCGHRYENIQSRFVTNGTNTTLGSAPWFVSLVINFDRGLIHLHGHQCGGSIISEEWVVTAAHCLYAGDYRIDCEKNCTIIAGSLKRNDTGYSYGTVHNIVKHIPFKEFDYTRGNDIALLKVSPPFKYRKPGKEGQRAIGAICLPEQDELITEKEGDIYGFGATNDTLFRELITKKTPWTYEDLPKLLGYPENLQSAHVNIINRDECAKIADANVDKEIIKTRGKNWRDFVLKRNAVVCAGNIDEFKFACFTDSGSPLTIYKNGKITLIGTTHRLLTVACVVKPVWYTVYTRVANFRDWINKITGIKINTLN